MIHAGAYDVRLQGQSIDRIACGMLRTRRKLQTQANKSATSQRQCAWRVSTTDSCPSDCIPANTEALLKTDATHFVLCSTVA